MVRYGGLWGVDEGYRQMDGGVVEVEVYRGAGITERQNPSGSPSVRKPETHRQAGLYLEPDNLLTDISRAVMQLPNSGNLGTKRIQGRLYGR